MITAMILCVAMTDGSKACVELDMTELECGQAILAVDDEFGDDLDWVKCTPVVAEYAMRPLARGG